MCHRTETVIPGEGRIEVVIHIFFSFPIFIVLAPLLSRTDFEDHIRVFFRHLPGKTVDKQQKQPEIALFFRDLRAFRTKADIIGGIKFANGVKNRPLSFRQSRSIHADEFDHVFCGNACNFRIAHAERTVRTAFFIAVNPFAIIVHGIIFRMRFIIFRRGDKVIDIVAVEEIFAVGVIHRIIQIPLVQLVIASEHPVGIYTGISIGSDTVHDLAAQENRDSAALALFQRQVRIHRNLFCIEAIPAAAELMFQKFGNGIQIAVVRMSANDQVLPDRLVHPFIRLHFCKVESVFFGESCISDIDDRFSGRKFRLVADR